jgi:N-carbamoylputrescine amidase
MFRTSRNTNMNLNIALLQMLADGDDPAANLAAGDRFCRRAAAMGADIALFPEMWSNGYAPCPREAAGRDRWAAGAIATDSQFVTHFRGLARELDMAIALTYLQAWEPRPRNAVSLIDRHGEIAFTYAKVHTCDFSDEAALTPGDEFFVADLDTRGGAVRVGAMICYDREFPESARLLMLQGAEVILTPNACDLERHRLQQFATRAYENMVAVAMTNYAVPQQNGHSVAFDGVAFDAFERGAEPGASIDTLVVEADGSEGVYLAAFDIERLRAYRRFETWGDAYRKPSVYAPLLANEPQPPFIRTDSRR